MLNCAAGVMKVLIIGAAGNLNYWCKCDMTEGVAERLIGYIFQKKSIGFVTKLSSVVMSCLKYLPS
jgi:hypothetical protein